MHIWFWDSRYGPSSGKQHFFPFPSFRSSAGACTCAYRSGLIVGSSGFRMNKHCLNRDCRSPGARCVPRSLLLPIHHFTVVPLRNSWLHFRLLRLAHHAAGALTLFEGRRTFLRSWLARLRGSTLISRWFATARSPLFFLPSLSFPFFPSFDSAIRRSSWCN